MSAAGPRSVRHCTVCGAPSPAGSAFCRNCGLALDVPRTGALAFCRSCGGEVTLGDAYCPTCGSPQPPNTKPPAMAPAPGVPPTPPQPAFPPAAPGYPQYQSDEAARYAEPGAGLQIVWYLFVGIWLSLLVTIGAWLVTITVAGQPLGKWIAHQVPRALTLCPGRAYPRLAAPGAGLPDVARPRPLQYSPGTRAIYFVAVGWWLSLVWLLLAYVLAVLVVPTPVAEWMYDHLAAITTLERE